MKKELNLRNVAGRVVYHLYNNWVVLESRTDGVSNYFTTDILDGEERVACQNIAQAIAGACKVAVGAEILEAVSKVNSFSSSPLCRLFADTIWLDVRGNFLGTGLQQSVLAQQVDISWLEGKAGRAINSDRVFDLNKITYAFVVLNFCHTRQRNAFTPPGERWTTMLTGPMFCLGVGDIMPVMYALNPFTGETLPDDVLLDEQGAGSAAGRSLLRLLYLVNMQNVKTERVPPANKMPKHERRYPKMEYRVLRIDRKNGVTSPRLEKQLRKSPRQHLRRGHPRQLPGGPVWIAPAIVGNPARGTIIHDYLL